ncbi:MAG: hypothetical protein CO096_17000 [Armatimonadetes bacterium CG_4_9_14_3_um_filter_66_14]|nr:MAG: hypothetical protein CO096_17000 [Armatimonadetes bacterium CG_4_9_14_3_um_filter_66_14]
MSNASTPIPAPPPIGRSAQMLPGTAPNAADSRTLSALLSGVSGTVGPAAFCSHAVETTRYPHARATLQART